MINENFIVSMISEVLERAAMKEPARSPGNGYRSFDQVV